MRIKTSLLLTAALLSLTACGNAMERIDAIGKKPPLSAVNNPQTSKDYAPVTWPLPEPEPSSARTANSLWQPGGRAFFRDQRAGRVGDILRVNIAINDQAKLDNATDRNRDSSETAAAPAILGAENQLEHLFPLTGLEPNAASLLNITGKSKSNGDGSIDRKEKVRTQIAALVTQVLPNGNLVIEGSQEILVNYEVREISVRGVIRPQDINSDNTIESNQVAQARIVYSGRGQITDVQQPRWGQQLVDVISPF
jgi:flagellar L-ring protein precursor FlgH